MSQVHPQARTTPRTRQEIRASKAPLTELASRYNVTVATARKWKGREDTQNRSHRPHTLSTTPSPAQEALVVELRRTLLLPLDGMVRHARQARARGSAKTCVVIEGDRIAGYFSLTVGQIDVLDAPERIRKGMGSCPVPAVILARLAGQAWGQVLSLKPSRPGKLGQGWGSK